MQGNKLFSMDKLTKSQQWHLLQVYTDHCSHILGNTILLGPGYTYTCQWHHQQMFFNFFIRPPGMVVPGSLMFDCWCFLYLLPIAVKLCHMIGSMFNFIIQVPKFGGPPPKIGAKYVQNSTWFRTTSDFDCEYLRNGWMYLKSERYVIDNDSSHVRQKKSSKLWSTNNSCRNTQINFFRKPSFRPLGGAVPHLFTRASKWPRFASAHPTRDGGLTINIQKLAKNSVY